MKRVKAACICQTLHFQLKEDIAHAEAVQMVRQEVAQYKARLDRNRIKYRIESETEQPDGSVIVKIIKQYNQCQTGEYLN